MSSNEYSVGQDVLNRWCDGLFYLGKVLKVDVKKDRCYIKYEDKSEGWAQYKDLRTAILPENEICCSVCSGVESVIPNEIVLCDKCGHGYHQKCHSPVIEDMVLQPDVPWFCRQCVFALATKKGGAAKKGPNAKALSKMKQTLSYDLSELDWDLHHKTNLQDTYCYCAGPGKWYLKMLQCCRCNQWFHEACVQCLSTPLLYGDRFHIFVCACCNFGTEYIKRIECTWSVVIQLALFNQTITCGKKFLDHKTSILPWIDENMGVFEIKERANISQKQRHEMVLMELENNYEWYANGRETRKKSSLYGLRHLVPPSPQSFFVPESGPVNDTTVKAKGAKLIRIRPVETCDTVVLHKRISSMKEIRSDLVKPEKRKLSLDSNEEPQQPRKRLRNSYYHQSAEDVEENEPEINSANQNYQGYNGLNNNNYKISVDDDEISTDCESMRMLEDIIPPPVNFTGIDNPFMTFIEREQLLNTNRSKVHLLNLYGAEYVVDDAVSLAESGDSARSYATVIGNDNNNDVRSSNNNDTYVVDWLKRGKRGARKLKRPRSVSKTAKEIDRSTDCTGRYDSSVSSSTGSNRQPIRQADIARSLRGKRIHVLAKRFNIEGKVQYLIEWEGFNATT
ncbi:metal-response element-binding transcription factor 2-like [Tubulanus polymorphus]|uniref:metal-response element-binding transcription factor 2-like n=1 Tax=Tubulanus polymorphus TaxID=672921 RepID=UPI003DA53C65